LVEGYDGKFRPDDNITREEAAVMLTRAVRSGNQPAVTPGTDPGKYEDWKDVSDWAAESVAHAVPPSQVANKRNASPYWNQVHSPYEYIVVKNAHEPIIPKDVFETVQQLIASR